LKLETGLIKSYITWDTIPFWETNFPLTEFKGLPS